MEIFDRTNYILAEPAIKQFLYDYYDPNQEIIIFDIGGCEGLDSLRYARLFPKARIFIFEPVPKNQEIIKKHILENLNTNITLIPIALWSRQSIKSFYLSSGFPHEFDENSYTGDWDFGNKSGSLLRPVIKNQHKWLEFNTKIRVKCDTIDNFCKQKNITKINFIHMDVQGGELEVLKGSKAMISTVDMIWLETSEIELYQSQKTKMTIDFFMLRNNFIEIFHKGNGPFGDVLYKRFDILDLKNIIFKYLMMVNFLLTWYKKVIISWFNGLKK